MTERSNVYIYSKHDSSTDEKIEKVRSILEKNRLNIVTSHAEANIVISMGGDGAFLQAVRHTGFRQNCLYAGISTTGTLSMYCDFLYEQLDDFVEDVISQEIEVRRYPIIEVTVDDNPPFYCLNEFSIRSNIVKTFVMDIQIDDLPFETFRGDGLIVATPTGSTAYNKSVNGAVVDPMLPCFQVTELASVNSNKYRTLGSSFILSGNRSLHLHLHSDGNDYPTMGMDNEALSIQHVHDIQIRLHAEPIKTVKLKHNSFWEKVKRIYL